MLLLDILLFISFQKEEGKVQGQLNHTDSSQYIRDLKDQIAELKHEVRTAAVALWRRGRTVGASFTMGDDDCAQSPLLFLCNVVGAGVG